MKMKQELKQKQQMRMNMVYAATGIGSLLLIAVLAFVFNLGNIRDSFASGASTAVWEGAYSTDWADKRNWKSGALPSKGADITIDGTYKYAPVVSGSVTNAAGDLLLQNGAKLTISGSGSLTVLDDVTINGATSALIMDSASLVVGDHLYLFQGAKTELSNNAQLTLSDNLVVSEGTFLLKEGVLKIKEGLVLNKDKSYYVQTGGELIMNGDLHLVSSGSSGNVVFDIRGGKTDIKGATRSYKNDPSYNMLSAFKVSGGNVTINELSRNTSDSSKYEGNFNFTISGGKTYFKSDLIMDTVSGDTSSIPLYCEGVSNWDKNTTYTRKDVNQMVEVSYNGDLYRLDQSLNWSKGDQPSKSKKSKWVYIESCTKKDLSYDCVNVKEWNSNRKYRRTDANDEMYVLYKDVIYRQHKNNWFTKGNDPDKNSWAWVEHYNCRTGSAGSDVLAHKGGLMCFYKNWVRPAGFTSYGNGVVQIKYENGTMPIRWGDKYVDLIIDTNVTVELNANVDISGDITNNSKIKPKGKFKFRLTGNGDQEISGLEDFVVSKIEVNKPSGKVYIRQDLKIDDKLIFKSKTHMISGEKPGSHKKSNHAVLTFGDNATYEGDGHFEGTVVKEGDDAFVFPTGANGRKGYIAMTAPATNATFEATYIEGKPEGVASVGNGLTRVSQLEYWELNRVSGTADVDPTLYWEDGSWSKITNPSELMVANYNGTKWVSLGNASYSGNADSGNVQALNTPSTYSLFTFGSSGNSNPLPVDFISFEGELQQEGVYLNWRTASEKNNDFFEVQRSRDGANFEVIGKVVGNGNKVTESSYDFVDYNQPSGLLYYRLRQVDFDGGFEYSSTLSISSKENEGESFELTSIYPSPFNERFTLEFVAPEGGQVNVSLLNMQGQTVYSEDLGVYAGHNSLNFDQGYALQKGYYLLVLEQNGNKINEKIYKN